jgi:SAM-dependent methyltransferase
LTGAVIGMDCTVQMTDPSHSEFWNTRYAAGQNPWNCAGVPADLQAYLKRKARKPGSAHARVLIPGCGLGFEIKAFAEAGFEVTGLDFSEVAVQQARQTLGPALAGRVLVGDFFEHKFEPASFDLIYERAFICSLPPNLRVAYRDRVAALLKHGGDLTGYFYYNPPDLEAGPPYGFAWGESDELFGRHFILLKDQPVNDSLPVFAGRERWQEQRRTAYPGG